MSSLIVEVCSVDSIIKHPNANKLSIVGIKGWNCIVGLDQYKVGDLVVFIPPDCVIPDDLIEKYNLTYLKKNGRTSTVKLRDYVSQGLILDIPEGNWKLGDNVAEVMNITKYQPPERKFTGQSGMKPTSKKKLNPHFDKYTDIENIKNYNTVFKDGDFVVVTEKIHGSNFRAGMLPIEIQADMPWWLKLKNKVMKFLGKKYEFVYGSHNVQLQGGKGEDFYREDMWYRVCKKYDLDKKIPPDCIIYGEVYGKGVQDLTYGLNDIDLMIFDVKKNGKYLGWKEVMEIADILDVSTVPVIFVGAYRQDMLMEWTDGHSIICPTQIREGAVIKEFNEINDPRIGRKILKSVSAAYLLRKDGTEYH